MSKKLSKIKGVHLQAVLVLIVYLVLSKINLVASSASGLWWISFFGPFAFGALAGLTFLYLFSHEDFFPVAREIEKKEKKEEEKWRVRLAHHSKVFICLAVGTLTSPVLSSLTARLLIHKHKFWYKYAVVVLGEIFSTVLYVGLIKGLIKIF